MRRATAALGAVLLIGGGALSGCGHDDAASKTSSTPSTTTSSSPEPEQTQTPKVKTPKPKDKLAPSTIAPVLRQGKRPHPTVSARPATMKGVVRYGDGVSLDITGIAQGRVTGKGPGIVQGPATTFSLALKNGSNRAIDLNTVVVTAVYGSPARIANPIYLDKSRDFAGTARPGATSTAVYTFGIPVNGRSRVAIHVDFDSRHTAAVFAGSAG